MAGDDSGRERRSNRAGCAGKGWAWILYGVPAPAQPAPAQPAWHKTRPQRLLDTAGDAAMTTRLASTRLEMAV